MRHGAGPLCDELHRALLLKMNELNRFLELNNRGERLPVHAALLYRECVGQKLLEKRTIKARMTTQLQSPAPTPEVHALGQASFTMQIGCQSVKKIRKRSC